MFASRLLRRWGGAGSLLLTTFLMGTSLHAQRGDDLPIDPAPESPDAIISLTAGLLQTASRNDFPSLIVGNSLLGSGIVPGAYAETGSGYRVELEGLIYFNEHIGLTLGLATTRYAAKYRGDSGLLPTTLEVQEAEFFPGVHADVLIDAYGVTPRLRSLYIEGGFEFGIGIMANRVTSSSVADTTEIVRTEAAGSFANNDPFRSRVALRFNAGTLIDLSGSASGLSLIVEAGYSIGLNPVFSSTVVSDSQFKVNHFIMQAGLGYRF